MSSNLDKVSAKILVLGDSGVGKSSLIHLICHSSVLSSAHWTIGCSIDIKLLDNYFLEFWDIGGSRSHKIARSFLYQDYHGIMLVFDATNNKSRLNLNEWLVEVTQKSNNDRDLESLVNISVPIITIATKKDLLPYESLLETERISSINYSKNTDEHCSVVNFGNDNPIQQQTNYPYRRLQTTSSSSSLTSHSMQPLFSASSTHSLTNLSPYGQDEPLLGNQVIHVNTQDVLSFTVGSRNHEKLNIFFGRVIDRRNKKFYNNFAI